MHELQLTNVQAHGSFSFPLTTQRQNCVVENPFPQPLEVGTVYVLIEILKATSEAEMRLLSL